MQPVSNKYPVRRLLIMVEWFSPGYRAGGPIQSCINICSVLQDQYDIFVLTTDTDHGMIQPYPGIEAGKWLRHPQLNVRVYYMRRKGLKAVEIATVIQQLQPDFIYLNLLFSPLFTLYPFWLKWRGRLTCRLVLCPRGTLYESALAVKSWKKIPVLFLLRRIGLARLVHFHATNDREKNAILHHFPGAHITVADNLPASYQGPFMPVAKRPGQLRCIFIARIVPIKNLLFLLEVLPRVSADIHLTIVGPAEEEAYWKICRSAIERLPSGIRVEITGAQPAAVLPGMIQQHHLFILPTRGENFGHAILEALIAGRPVLISDQTPWKALEEKKAGWDISLGEPASFARVMGQVAAMDQEAYDEWAKGAWHFAEWFIRDNSQRQRYLELFS